MASNENDLIGGDADLAILDNLERDLRVGISLSEARVQRLMQQAFNSTGRAERGLRKLISSGGVDHAIKVMTESSFANISHFGVLRMGLFFTKRPAARAALAQLPDALRDLQQMIDRRTEVHTARHNLRCQSPAQPTHTSEIKSENVNARRLRRRRH